MIKRERQLIAAELRRAVADVEAARRKFNEVTDPRLVDAAALELSAAEARLRAVLMYARNAGNEGVGGADNAG